MAYSWLFPTCLGILLGCRALVSTSAQDMACESGFDCTDQDAQALLQMQPRQSLAVGDSDAGPGAGFEAHRFFPDTEDPNDGSSPGEDRDDPGSSGAKARGSFLGFPSRRSIRESARIFEHLLPGYQDNQKSLTDVASNLGGSAHTFENLLPEYKDNQKSLTDVASNLGGSAHTFENLVPEYKDNQKSLANAASTLNGSAHTFKNLLPEYEDNQNSLADVASRLEQVARDLQENEGNLTDKIASIPGQEVLRVVPPSSFGPCDVEVAPKQTCKESELQKSASGTCEFTVSNKISEASTTALLLPGCRVLSDSFQELFLYCNDFSEFRRVTATTCGSTANFNHKLAAFINSSSCVLAGCEDSTDRFPCSDGFTGDGEDPRATIQFTVPPGLCAYIVQQCNGDAGEQTDVLSISSQGVSAGAGGGVSFAARGRSWKETQHSKALLEVSQGEKAQQVFSASEGTLAGLAEQIVQEVTHGLKQQFAQEIAQAKEDIFQELHQEKRERQQLQHIVPDLLGALPADADAGVSQTARVHHLRQRREARDESNFELCRNFVSGTKRDKQGKQSNVSALSQTSSKAVNTCTQSVPIFEPGDGTYSIECCNYENVYCAGCIKLGNSSCDTCAGGFVDTNGVCEACMDFAWKNKEGFRCYEISTCDDVKFKGLSSNEACCHCGGGHRAATPFTYFVNATAVGASSIEGFPVPRTASKYSLDKECELLKYGLTIDSTTGQLEFVDGCTSVGCGTIEEAFTVSCTVTAAQTSQLTASTQLTVIASEGFSYRTPLIFFDDASLPTSYFPQLTETNSVPSFSLTGCSPSDVSEHVTLDSATGELTLSGDPTSGVTGVDGIGAAAGGICYVTLALGNFTEYTVPVVLVMPMIWSELSYGQGGTLYATVGQRSPLLKPSVEEGKLPPSRFSASIVDPDFSFDVLTGAGTYKGLLVFRLDVSAGYFRLEPVAGLVDVFEDSSTRAELAFTVTIFAHYEWPSLGAGPVKVAQLEISVRDSTCWVSSSESFSKRSILGSVATLGACKKLCQIDAQCTHMRLESSTCYSYNQLCSGDCEFDNVTEVEAKYTSCGERTSCINVSIPDHFYLSGQYCPYGEAVSASGDGQVFLKIGRTEQDSFWLLSYEEDLDTEGACSTGTKSVLRSTNPEQDFWNASSNYVEHHGSIVACLSSSISDFVSNIFETSTDSVSVAVVGGASLSSTMDISVPSCGPPNLTLAQNIQRGSEATVTTSNSGVLVSGLILDDPSTPGIEADYWLHPCHCAPPAWGSNDPVSAETFREIPPESGNVGEPLPFLIVEGAFVCEQEYLLGIHLAAGDPGPESPDSEFCQVTCGETDGCRFFWVGQVGDSKQCWTYSACYTLYRRVGLSGSLMAWPQGSQVCRISNPELCWHTTNRREFLTASQLQSTPTCLHQSLFEQCDQKLMLGGASLSACGTCKYALIPELPSAGGIDFGDETSIEALPYVSSSVVDGTEPIFFSSLAFKSDYLHFLYNSSCYYIKQRKTIAATPADEVAFTMTATWPSVVYLQWWDSADCCPSRTRLRIDPFLSWEEYGKWRYVMNTSGPRDDGRDFDTMWFSRAFKANEEIRLYGSGAANSTDFFPYFVYICPQSIEVTNSLKKSLLPSVFPHGSALHARCWTQRYVATTFPAVSELRCVAGQWINGNGTRGLTNFECAACIEVVSASHEALVAKFQQELFFASRWNFELRILDGNGNPFSWNSDSCEKFVADLPGNSNTMRYFRSTDCAEKCMNATESSGLTLADCNASGSQLLDGNEVVSQLLLHYLAENEAKLLVTGDLSGEEASSLKDLLLEDSCNEAFVMSSFSLGQADDKGDTVLGMSKTCVPASILDTDAEKPILLKVVLRNTLHKQCLGYGDCLQSDGGQCFTTVSPCFESEKQLFVAEIGQVQTEEEDDGDVSASRVLLFADDAMNLGIRGYYEDKGTTFLLSDRANVAGGETFWYGTQKLDSGDEESKFMCYWDRDSRGNGGRWLSAFQKGEFSWGFTQLEAADDATTEPLEAFQWKIDELPGLTEAQIDCGSNHVIQDLKKNATSLVWKCAEVAGLGDCVETASLDAQADSLQALRFVKVDCGNNAALQSLQFESNSVSYSLRLKAKCCSVAQLPVVFNVTDEFSSDFYNGDLIPLVASEGTYCPTNTLDASGRPKFQQTFSHKPGAAANSTLQYNRDSGQWCLQSSSSSSCVSNDVVHPLDLGVSLDSFQVIPVFDFSSNFAGQGAEVLAAPETEPVGRWQTPPQLLSFVAEDPIYRPECKDEVYPGTGEGNEDEGEPRFKRQKMNQVAEGLDVENPCHYIWSEPFDEEDGLPSPNGNSWAPRENASSSGLRFKLAEPAYSQQERDSEAPGQGLTYRTVKECMDRETSRDFEYNRRGEFWSLAEDITRTSFEYPQHLAEFLLDANGGGDSKFFNFGGLTPGGQFWWSVVKLGLNVFQTTNELSWRIKQNGLNRHYNRASKEDCPALGHGLARMFCDLHCIRDAVKTGDATILRQLLRVGETISSNTKTLFEFYLGEDQGATGLLQSESAMVTSMAQSLRNMQQMVQTARMHPLGQVAATRSINEFLSRVQVLPPDTSLGSNGSNLTTHLGLMSDQVKQLHAAVKVATAHEVSHSQYVSDNVAEYVKSMTEVMRSKVHTLGIFHRTATQSKQRQIWLRGQADKTSLDEVLSEVRSQSMMLATDSIDKTWWQLRAKFDVYFDVYEDYLAAFQTALAALDSYTERCSMSFSGLKASYATYAKANVKTKNMLAEVWTATNPMVGLLVSQVLDTEILKHFAVNDLQSVNATALLQGGSPEAWCSPPGGEALAQTNETKGFLELQRAVETSMQNGLFGQILQQFEVLFTEMDMLLSKFESEGLGKPSNEEVFKDSKERLIGVLELYAEAQKAEIAKMWTTWKDKHCVEL